MKNPQSAIRNPQSVELSIDELILHGFPPSDRYRIGEAVERELARLFVEQGVPPPFHQSSEIARLDGGVFQVPLSARADAVGAQVAQAVYEGFSGVRQ